MPQQSQTSNRCATSGRVRGAVAIALTLSARVVGAPVGRLHRAQGFSPARVRTGSRRQGSEPAPPDLAPQGRAGGAFASPPPAVRTTGTPAKPVVPGQRRPQPSATASPLPGVIPCSPAGNGVCLLLSTLNTRHPCAGRGLTGLALQHYRRARTKGWLGPCLRRGDEQGGRTSAYQRRLLLTFSASSREPRLARG